jgi:PBP1b-binding outer membrane lipoprotein LpoB
LQRNRNVRIIEALKLKVMMKRYVFIVLASGLLFSCGGGDKEEEDAPEKPEVNDSTGLDTIAIDTVAVVDTTTIPTDTITELDPGIEVTESTSIEEFEKATEDKGGLSFCDCVKKQEDLNAQLDATEDDDEVERLFTAMEALTKGECKVLMMGGQTSPEQRKARQRQIDKCKKG